MDTLLRKRNLKTRSSGGPLLNILNYNAELARSCYKQQDKHDQVNERQLFQRKRIIPVNHEESHSHGKNHRDHCQPIERTEIKANRTKKLPKNGQA